MCNNATKTIESKYPPTGEKYYLTNENGERLGDGNYIGVAPVAMSEKTNGYFQYVKLPQ